MMVILDEAGEVKSLAQGHLVVPSPLEPLLSFPGVGTTELSLHLRLQGAEHRQATPQAKAEMLDGCCRENTPKLP